MKVTYPGPFEQIELGHELVAKGQTIDRPAGEARQLLAQGWITPRPRSKRATKSKSTTSTTSTTSAAAQKES